MNIMNPSFVTQKMASHFSKSQIPKLFSSLLFSTLFHFSHRLPMAKPTNSLPILAHPEPDSPPLKPHFKTLYSDSMANLSTHPKLEPSMASDAASKLFPLSKHILFSRMSSNPPPLMLVSSMLKSKPHLQKVASSGDEKLSKKEANDEKALCIVVKKKELKEPKKGDRLESLRPTVSVLPNGGRRPSFVGSLVELGDIFTKNGVKVLSVDMPPSMIIHAVDCARKAHDSMEKFTSKTLALSLKREFDGVYGPAWHCIVGTSFGSFVTHSVGGFLYFSLDQKLYILLFKTSVQKAD